MAGSFFMGVIKMVWKKYGLEIEFTGITRKRAAELVAEHFKTTAAYSFEGDKYSIADERGRTWAVLPCPGVRAERWQNNRMVGANYLYQTKVCTPWLYENDFETLEKILDRLDRGGAVINESTGMMVSLCMTGLDNREKFESNLANLYESRGTLLQKAVGRTFDSLADCSLLDEQGVVSLPLFPCSLDGNDVRSYVQLSQGIADFAAKSKGIRQKENDSPNEKFRLRLVRIGFVGEEYKHARKLLTENLSGNSGGCGSMRLRPSWKKQNLQKHGWKELKQKLPRQKWLPRISMEDHWKAHRRSSQRAWKFFLLKPVEALKTCPPQRMRKQGNCRRMRLQCNKTLRGSFFVGGSIDDTGL